MNFPTTFIEETHFVAFSVCNKRVELKYDVVSNLASICDFFCEIFLKFFTVNFYYCLFSILFMIMKHLSNMKNWRFKG